MMIENLHSILWENIDKPMKILEEPEQKQTQLNKGDSFQLFSIRNRQA